jgi:predicted AAA+ superfamily ATPase
MFENVLAEQNPHWDGLKYGQVIERESLNKLISYLKVPQVIAVTGVRRAGKSTLLKQAIDHLVEEGTPPSNILFTNLEHPYFSQYSHDVQYLEKLFEDYLKIANPKGKIYCFLDEIQFFSKWPIFIKAHYEQKGVKFIITGSNSFLMSHELLTLLSGRTLPIEVYPLSFGELIRARVKIKELTPLALAQHRHEIRRWLDKFLRFGGFPEVVMLEDDTLVDDILNAYSKTILYQDVASRLNIKKPVDLERLFYYLSSNIGSSFTYKGLAELFDLTDKTIKEYIEALKAANLLFEVDKFSWSLKHQIRAPKKIYSIDPGMVNAIAFKFSENRGKLFENILYIELKRRKKEIFYYKTASGYEVDFLTKEQKKLELIQVCVDLHEKAELREVRALIQAAKELELSHGTLITADVEKTWTLDGIALSAIPLYRWAVTE